MAGVAEAAFVIQMIGGCAELVKIVHTVVSRARAFNKSRYEVPRQFRNLQAVLGLLQVVLQRVEDRQRKSALEAAQAAQLRRLLINCKLAMNELYSLFQKHHLPENCRTTSLDNLKRAIQGVAAEKRLIALREEIQQNIHSITSYTSAFQPTAKEISEVVSSDLENVIDTKISEFARHLARERRHSNCSQKKEAGPRYNGQNITIYNISTTALDATNIGGVLGTGQGVSPRPSMDTMRTAPAAAGASWQQANGVAAYQFEPSIRSRRSHAGPEPDPGFLHPGDRLHRTDSIASSTSRSSSQSSTRVPSVFDGSTTPIQSPLTEDGLGFMPTSPRVENMDPNLLALSDANILIAQGDSAVPGPGHPDITAAIAKAQRAFNSAIVKLETISERLANIALRKRRGLTHAYLGLTRVTKGEERERHLYNAQRHNEDAHAAARRYADSLPSEPTTTGVALSKAKLDKARILARRARIAEKPSNAKRQAIEYNSPTATSLRREAFAMYEELVAAYEVGCITAAEYDIHAQALLGCGQVVQLLKATEGVAALAAYGCEEPGHYFNRANQSIKLGAHVPGRTAEMMEDLQSTLARIGKSWNLPGLADPV